MVTIENCIATRTRYRTTNKKAGGIARRVIYTILWAISTVSIAYFSDTLGYNHLYSWAANTAALGFLTFLALRIFAFPLSDGRITRKERLEQYKERRRA